MCCEVLCKRFQKKYQNNYEDLNWARLVFSSSPRHKGLFLQRLFSTTVVLLGWEEGRLIEEDSKDFVLLYSIIEVDLLISIHFQNYKLWFQKSWSTSTVIKSSKKSKLMWMWIGNCFTNILFSKKNYKNKMDRLINKTKGLKSLDTVTFN